MDILMEHKKNKSTRSIGASGSIWTTPIERSKGDDFRKLNDLIKHEGIAKHAQEIAEEIVERKKDQAKKDKA